MSAKRGAAALAASIVSLGLSTGLASAQSTPVPPWAKAAEITTAELAAAGAELLGFDATPDGLGSVSLWKRDGAAYLCFDTVNFELDRFNKSQCFGPPPKG